MKMPLSSIYTSSIIACLLFMVTEGLVLVHVQINGSMILSVVRTMLHLKCFIDLTVLKQIYGALVS